MLQAGLDLALAPEPGAERHVVAEVRGEQLEGDDPFERQLRCLVHGAHAALPEHAVNPVSGQCRADREHA
jgi:hypothetical protein